MKKKKIKLVLLIISLLLAGVFGYLIIGKNGARIEQIEQKKSEPELIYENLQYNYSVILPGGWRTSELGSSGKIVAFIAPETSSGVKTREEILKAGGILIQPQVSGLSKPAELIAYRNDWEKYLQQSGAEFQIESRKIGRYDGYLFTVKIPENKAGISKETHIFIDTAPKILIQTADWNKTIEDIVSRIESDAKLFQNKKSKIDEINLFLGSISQKKYEEAYEKINNPNLQSADQLKKIVAGKEDWFGGATVWYSISTQANQELYRGAILREKDKHLIFVRVNIEGSVRRIREFSITPAVDKEKENE